jgi:hypothetical protein
LRAPFGILPKDYQLQTIRQGCRIEHAGGVCSLFP